MPQVIHSRSKRKRTLINWVVVIGALVITLAIVGFFDWRASQDKAAFNSAMQQATLLDHDRRYQDEKAGLEAYLNTNPPSQYRLGPYTVLGTISYQQRDYQGAINYYEAAVASNGGKPTEYLAEDIGQAAASAGDNATALKYFKLAIQLTDPKAQGTDLGDLKATVKNLESKQ